MQLDPQEFLALAEPAGKIAFVDIETTGRGGDYNSVLVVSIKPYDQEPTSFVVKQPGNDQRVVREAKQRMEALAAWVTFYGKGFDIPMLNTRLCRWGIEPIAPRPHVDIYFVLRGHLLMERRSQAHYLRWLETPEKKMDLSPEEWNRVLANPTEGLRTLTERCESDVRGLEMLYKRVKHLIRDIRR